ncbi:MAG: hypothetical protein KC766_08875 [Myxococcales bacterium]|nr:hypothetical protein [Myxococcales bacterium]
MIRIGLSLCVCFSLAAAACGGATDIDYQGPDAGDTGGVGADGGTAGAGAQGGSDSVGGSGANGGDGGNGGSAGAGAAGAGGSPGGNGGGAGTGQGGGGNGGVAGTAQGGSGGSTMIMCNDPGDCPPAPGGLPVQVDACCTPQGTCGVSSSLIGGGQCIEGGQPGQPSTECMDFSQGGFTLKGCCRPDGTCGILDTFLGLGCVDPSQFGAPGGGGTCTP